MKNCFQLLSRSDITVYKFLFNVDHTFSISKYLHRNMYKTNGIFIENYRPINFLRNMATNLTYRYEKKKCHYTCILRFQQPQCDILLTHASSYECIHICTCILRRVDRSIASGPLHILSGDCYIGSCMRYVRGLHHVHRRNFTTLCVFPFLLYSIWLFFARSLIRLAVVLT